MEGLDGVLLISEQVEEEVGLLSQLGVAVRNQIVHIFYLNVGNFKEQKGRPICQTIGSIILSN